MRAARARKAAPPPCPATGPKAAPVIPARRLAAEAIGTGTLLAVVVGSGVMGERLAAGDAATALLVNAIATGAALAVLITVLGPISGAHLNPAVTLVFALRRRIGAGRAAGYVAAQLAGALIGVWAARTWRSRKEWRPAASSRRSWARCASGPIRRR